MSKTYLSNKTISKLITQIQDKALERLTGSLNFENYVSLTVYDCGGTWQAWLDFGKSGKKTTHEILLDGKEYVEGRTLRSTIIRLKNLVLNEDVAISKRNH
jgi:alkyl hydroperoxide reductase subunit AhpF